jgi:2-hydroxychromene-2-carboxylate isomerase
MTRPAAVEFWFELASTYSYPASQRVEAVARDRGVPIVWRAFLLGPIFQEQGWNDSPFNIYPVKGRYMWRDLERICADLELPFRRPSQFPRGSLLAARIACRFAEEPWAGAFVRAVYRANFAEDRDISDAAVVADCLRQSGAPPEATLAEAGSPESKQMLRDATEEAGRRGIFGAPAFLVGDELFWGNDRLEAAFDWYARAAGGVAKA